MKATIEYGIHFHSVCGQSTGTYFSNTLKEALGVLKRQKDDGCIVKYLRHPVPLRCGYSVIRQKRDGKVRCLR